MTDTGEDDIFMQNIDAYLEKVEKYRRAYAGFYGLESDEERVQNSEEERYRRLEELYHDSKNFDPFVVQRTSQVASTRPEQIPNPVVTKKHVPIGSAPLQIIEERSPQLEAEASKKESQSDQRPQEYGSAHVEVRIPEVKQNKTLEILATLPLKEKDAATPIRIPSREINNYQQNKPIPSIEQKQNNSGKSHLPEKILTTKPVESQIATNNVSHAPSNTKWSDDPLRGTKRDSPKANPKKTESSARTKILSDFEKLMLERNMPSRTTTNDSPVDERKYSKYSKQAGSGQYTENRTHTRLPRESNRYEEGTKERLRDTPVKKQSGSNHLGKEIIQDKVTETSHKYLYQRNAEKDKERQWK